MTPRQLDRPIRFTSFPAVVMAATLAMTGCYVDSFPVSGAPHEDADADGFSGSGDCNDADATIFPGADERCDDGIDNDCDGNTDALDPECDAGAGGSGGSDGAGGAGGSGGAVGSSGAGGSGGGL